MFNDDRGTKRGRPAKTLLEQVTENVTLDQFCNLSIGRRFWRLSCDIFLWGIRSMREMLEDLFIVSRNNCKIYYCIKLVDYLRIQTGKLLFNSSKWCIYTTDKSLYLRREHTVNQTARYRKTIPGFWFSAKNQCSLVPNLLNQPIRIL